MFRELKSESHLVLLVAMLLISIFLVCYSSLCANIMLVTMVILLLFLSLRIKNHGIKKLLIVFGISTVYLINLIIGIPNEDDPLQLGDICKEYKWMISPIRSVNENNVSTIVAKVISTSPENKKLKDRLVYVKSNRLKGQQFKKFNIVGKTVKINPGNENVRVENARNYNDTKTKRLQYLTREKRQVTEILEYKSVSFGWAMLTGSKEFLTKNEQDLFLKTGTIHLFAVSGLHIGFFYLLLTILFYPIKLNGAILLIIKLIICFFYIFLIDFPYSALRAFLMIGVFEICRFLYIKQKVISFFSISMIILLVFDSSIFFSLSAQLSYTVVLFILFSIPHKVSNLSILKSSIYNIYRLIVISVSASAGSSLLVLDYFNHFSFLGVLANILISPLIFIFYTVNILFFLSFLAFDSLFLLDFHNCFYEIINFIIKSVFNLSSILPEFSGISFEIINLWHFCVFLCLLFTFCFRFSFQIKAKFIFLYYGIFWLYCFIASV